MVTIINMCSRLGNDLGYALKKKIVKLLESDVLLTQTSTLTSSLATIIITTAVTIGCLGHLLKLLFLSFVLGGSSQTFCIPLWRVLHRGHFCCPDFNHFKKN